MALYWLHQLETHMYPKQAKLQNISHFSAEDFCLDEFGYVILQEAEGSMVTVLGKSLDGYYDIMMSDGVHFDAISGHHLEGFDQLTM